MSNHGARQKPPKASKLPLLLTTAAVATAFILALTIFYLAIRGQKWNHSSGQLLETRVVVMGTRDASQAHPAVIYYRAEARVSYNALGRSYTSSLPTTIIQPDRNLVAFELSKRIDNQAEVNWDSTNPTHGMASLHLR